MTDRWQVQSLGDMCNLATGGTPSRARPEFFGGAIPWLVSGDINQGEIVACEGRITEAGMKACNAKLLPRDSVMIALNGQGKTRATVAMLRIEATCNQSLVCISPKDRSRLIPEFVYANLHGRYEELRRLTSDDDKDRRGLNMGILRNIKIPVPPVAEQQRIVGILDEAFAGIATAKINAERSIQNARAVFEAHLDAVFAEAWQVGELVTLSDLATDITDGDHMPPPKSEAGVPFVTIGNVDKRLRTIDFSDTFMVPRKYFEGLKANKRPKVGDVLYTVTGSFGIPVLVRDHREFCFQRHIGLIRPKADVASSWLYYLLLSPQVVKQAHAGATGAAQKTVSLKLLRSFEVPSTPMERQVSCVNRLEAISDETYKLESIYQRKLAALDELKQSLLHQAFSGQL